MKTVSDKIILTMMIIVTLLVNTGCTQVYSSNKDYQYGTEGVLVEFSESNPESVYEQEEFGNYININNKGSYDITDSNPGKLMISYDTYRLSSEGANGGIELTDVTLQGKNKRYPIGEDFPFEVYFVAESLTHLRESSITTINYNFCYPYFTELTTMTCIDTKTPTRGDAAAACKVEEYNGAKGQGAPIVITKIVPEILLQQKYVRPQFKIYVENVGGGYVTDSTSCDEADINDIKSSSKVKVHAWLSSKKTGSELQCGPVETNGILRLVDSESYIRCYLPAKADGYSIAKRSYVTPLIVEIEYTYVSISEQEIEILRNNILEENVTQGLCPNYQVEYDGKCRDKCVYCSENPDSELCQENYPYEGFKFGEDFSCSCLLDSCNAKLSRGSCIKGYCAGDLYCCSTKKCDQWQIEYNGQCKDKCEYCATEGVNDPQICGTGFNFTGFQCEAITESVCNQYAQSQACIFGYCGGDNKNKYCANPGKARIINAATGTQETLCAYCARINGADNRCLVAASDGTMTRIENRDTKNFGCYCNFADKDKMPGSDFITDNGLCNGVNYCCNSMAIQRV